MKVVFLEIRSWVGTCAIGAIHTYGTLKWHPTEKPGDYSWKEEMLQRPLTASKIRAQNAEYLEQGFQHLKVKRGTLTRGFMTREEVIRAGTEKAKALFNGEDYIVIIGDGCSMSAQSLAYWPTRFSETAKRINELAEEWQRLPSGRVADSRAEEIDSEWLRLIRTIAPQI